MTEVTGRFVFAVVAGAFGVIIAVNLLLAYKAVSTFPGLEVGNSYVASQTFDVARRQQIALGWTMTPEYDAGAGQLSLRFTGRDGKAAPVAGVSALVGRTTEAKDDQRPDLVQAAGVWTAPLVLAPGKWLLRIDATAADGTAFSQRVALLVRGARDDG